MRRLVERGAGELVAAAADPALHVGLAGLVALRGQAEVAPTSRERRNRSGRSMVARNASAVSGPTPGTPISRRQTGSSRTLGETAATWSHHFGDKAAAPEQPEGDDDEGDRQQE